MNSIEQLQGMGWWALIKLSAKVGICIVAAYFLVAFPIAFAYYLIIP